MKLPNWITIFCLALLTTCWSGSLTFAQEDEPQPILTNAPHAWPSFLGAGATEILPDNLPTHWSPAKNIAWQTKLPGTGQSSPVIWNDQVFITTIEGNMKDACCVSSLSLEDGEILWTNRTQSAQPVRSNYYQSRSAPTPAVDADRVYAFFETGNLVALNHSGEKLWTRNLAKDYGEFEVRIGLAASLAQTRTSILVLVDHEGPSYLISIDKRSGKTLWKTDRFSRQSYSSPMLLNVSGQPQVVCSSSGSIDGYDPDSGELLWTYEEVGGNRSVTPLPLGDSRFLIGASPGMHGEYSAEARTSNLALKIEKVGGSYQPQVLWKVNVMPSFASPIEHRGLVYWISGLGVLNCFDAETGKPVYRKRTAQRCWSTPLGLGDRIYLFGKDGLTTVISAGREYKVLARNELFDGATEAGAADIRRREERERRMQSGSPPSGTGNDTERNRSREGLVFADPIQYGYAAVTGSLVIRTGGVVYCIREDESSSDVKGGSQ